MPTDAEIRRRKKQDATRKRVAIWLDAKTAKALDKLRKKTPRATFVRRMIEESDRARAG